MKQKLSITVDKEKVELIEAIIKQGRFRNKSHFVECGIDCLLEEKNDTKK